MKIRFIGGANEVGASSTLIEIDENRILVDAGIRMGPGQNSQLPDFPEFGEVGMPNAVLLTHAHSDHTGALPVLRNLWLAGVKVYYTAATKAITRVLLEDSANRTGSEAQEEGKPPLYSSEDVAIALHCMEKEVQWLKPEQICDGVTATWIPAGHILGAAMIYIQGEHESILMTGDVSSTNQSTIPGMDGRKLPYQPDVMVMESTYGKRRHKVTRKEESKKLIDDVVRTIEKGGKVLIPAFAVGRSQEVILILKYAMERKEVPQFPVYVDGMVQKINDVYSRFSDELSISLRRKAEHGKDLFYSDAIKKVSSDQKREQILNGEPCCIVASSGMLIGGRSASYAKSIATNRMNLIAITGYQAEGTPGRALQDLSKVDENTVGEWKLDADTTVSVECQVERYRLSAHADSDELMEFVKKVSPHKLFLVHGDADARGELFKSVCKTLPSIDVKLPQNGNSYSVTDQPGIANGRKLNSQGTLSELRACLWKEERNRSFRIRELVEKWFGTERTTQETVDMFELLLSFDGQFFERRSGLIFLRQPIK